jgi:hypothetical protein
MESRPTRLGLALLLLAGGAAAILAGEGGFARRPSGDFQQLVGGLGFGGAGDLSGCAHGFDPRLERGCGMRCGPVPGGDLFCPRHGGRSPAPPRSGGWD